MIFHEIYGCYYNTVAKILCEALNGELTEKSLADVVKKNAFSESVLTVIPALKTEKWQLLKSDFSTPILHAPTMPLTLAQKRWLKALTLDPRIKLFDADFSFLDGVRPLFTPDDYTVFDKYSDGDDFSDENYIKIFRELLFAAENEKKVKIFYRGSKGSVGVYEGDPYKLEYSEKDDKFRVLLRSCRKGSMLRVGGIQAVNIVGDAQKCNTHDAVKSEKSFTVEVVNRRNSLERVLFHFAHFKKEAEKITDECYRIKIYYDITDETELVIRVLSFGPFVKVTAPESFKALITERLLMQKKL